MKLHQTKLTSVIVLTISVFALSGCTLLPANQPTDSSSDTSTDAVDSANQTETQLTLTQTATSSTTGGGTVEQTQQASVISPELIVLTATVDGQSALELLSANTKVATKSFGDAGEFVESINGKSGDAQHYWAFYVNDAYAEKGADSTILQKGDTIKFQYMTISDSPLME